MLRRFSSLPFAYAPRTLEIFDSAKVSELTNFSAAPTPSTQPHHQAHYTRSLSLRTDYEPPANSPPFYLHQTPLLRRTMQRQTRPQRSRYEGMLERLLEEAREYEVACLLFCRKLQHDIDDFFGERDRAEAEMAFIEGLPAIPEDELNEREELFMLELAGCRWFDEQSARAKRYKKKADAAVKRISLAILHACKATLKRQSFEAALGQPEGGFELRFDLQSGPRMRVVVLEDVRDDRGELAELIANSVSLFRDEQ